MRFVLVLLLLIAACQPALIGPSMSMPCHTMPDGSMMGDCGGEGEFLIPGEVASEAPKARHPEIYSLSDGDVVTLRASVVEKTIRGVPVRMLAYNGMIPGPIFRGNVGDTFTVNFENDIGQESTIHWHGLRHDNKDDGVPGVTQDAVQSGSSYTYSVRLADKGIFWYHPHVREDVQQDAGLAGNILVVSEVPSYVSREELLVLDDILLSEDGIVPYGKEQANHAVMGRFGNVLLVNGEERYELDVRRGDVVRFYVTNVANVRPFNLSFGGAPMKLVGTDLSEYERETFVESIVIAPAERYIVDVLFDEEKSYKVLHVNPYHTYELGTIRASGESKTGESSFYIVGEKEAVVAEFDRFRPYFDKEADYELELDIDMRMMMNMRHTDSDQGIEWEDTMHMMNAMHDTSMLRWIIRDIESGNENDNLMIRSKVGDVVKIRIHNREDSSHPMQHPIHLHGQRFVVISEDGEESANLAWKDTVLIPSGSSVDILVDVTNPGTWMLHCHIAEHLEGGMMSHFIVK